jgi:hypothetical protein
VSEGYDLSMYRQATVRADKLLTVRRHIPIDSIRRHAIVCYVSAVKCATDISADIISGVRKARVPVLPGDLIVYDGA